jgi:hypothetical protein
MHKYSEQQQIVCNLFMILIFLHQHETDNLLDSTINTPIVPSLGKITAPRNPGWALVLDLLFDDEAMVSDLLQLVLSNQYLHNRLPGRTHDEFNLAQLFDMRADDFKQAVRPTKSGFIWLLNEIQLNPIFMLCLIDAGMMVRCV